MARQFRIRRKIAAVPVIDNGFATIDLPRDYDYETIGVRLTGAVTVTGAATAVRAESPTQAINRIELTADGKNSLFQAPFWFAVLGNKARQTLETGARAVTPPTAVAPATYQIEALGFIDPMTIDAVRPKDSNFRSSGLSLFQLRLSFGNAASLFVGGTMTPFANTQLMAEVFTSQMVEMPDAQGMITTPIALKKVSFQEIALQSSNANQEIRLPAGNLIKEITVRTDGLTTAGEPTTGVINNVQLAAGVDVRVNLSGGQIRAFNNAAYGYVPNGLYHIDITEKGSASVNLTDLWDVSGAAEPKLILDVVGGANVKCQVIVTEYIMNTGNLS